MAPLPRRARPSSRRPAADDLSSLRLSPFWSCSSSAPCPATTRDPIPDRPDVAPRLPSPLLLRRADSTTCPPSTAPPSGPRPRRSSSRRHHGPRLRPSSPGSRRRGPRSARTPSAARRPSSSRAGRPRARRTRAASRTSARRRRASTGASTGSRTACSPAAAFGAAARRSGSERPDERRPFPRLLSLLSVDMAASPLIVSLSVLSWCQPWPSSRAPASGRWADSLSHTDLAARARTSEAPRWPPLCLLTAPMVPCSWLGWGATVLWPCQVQGGRGAGAWGLSFLLGLPQRLRPRPPALPASLRPPPYRRPPSPSRSSSCNPVLRS